MLRLLTIHEAVPGHYLQGVYANRSPSIARAIFGSGVFAEGWAVYVTQVMMDAGLRRRRPGAAADPLEVLPAGGRQRPDRRRDPHRRHDRGRGRLADDRRRRSRRRRRPGRSTTGRGCRRPSSRPTSSGRSLFWDLEHEARRRAAAAVGRSARRRRGARRRGSSADYGETPGFVYREHLEACLDHGTPPMPLLRRRMLD